MSRCLKALTCFLFLSALGLCLLWLNLASLSTAAINRYIPQQTGLPLSVEDCEIDLLAGRLRLYDLQLANPELFSQPHFLALAELDLSWDWSSLRRPVFEFDRVLADGVVVTLEQRGGENNLQWLQAQLGSTDLDTASGEVEQGERRALSIESLQFNDITVTLLLEGRAAQQLTIDRLNLAAIGSSAQGVSADLAMQAVLRSLSDKLEEVLQAELLRQGEEKLIDAARQKIERHLDKYQQKIERWLGR